MSRPTIKEVAAAAAVSKATVSLVLRDSPQIPEATKQRVRDAIASVGYVYNRRAAEMRSLTSRILGLVVSNVRNPYFAELTMAIEDTARESGHTLILGCSGDDVRRQFEVITAMSEHQVDGIILLPASHTEASDLESLLLGRSLPHALVARAVPGYSCDYVGADNETAGALVGRHLRDRGVQTVGFLGGTEGSVPRDDRIRGVLSGLGEDTTTLDLDVSAHYDAGEGMEDLVERALSLGSLPDAIVAYNDMHAFGIMSALRARGIRPGDDVAIASFDNVPEASRQFPPLTSADGFPAQVGRVATQLVLQGVAHEPQPAQRVLIDPHLHERDSTQAWIRLAEGSA